MSSRRKDSAAQGEPVREVSARRAGAASTPATSQDQSLTVDDFVRAADTIAPAHSIPAPAAAAPLAAKTASPSGIYASGVAQPDQDVSDRMESAAAATMKPVPQKQPAVAASVDAAPLERASLPQHAAPSDLVGAPDATTQQAAQAEQAAQDQLTREEDEREQASAASLRTPTRQELTEEVEQPVVLPGLYRNGRLLVPPPLRGTREILIHQNTMADDEGLTRIQDDDDLRRMRSEHLLMDFPQSASLRVNPELAGDRRCARPWAVHFASDIARAFYARFHEPLQVNSAVRTVAYQVRLRRVNGNAAGIDGDMASPHLTGQAMDFGKRGMSTAEIAWMRMYLLPLMQSGKLDVEEEFQQACFHISVYRAYAPGSKSHAPARSEVAQLKEPRVTRIAYRADPNR